MSNQFTPAEQRTMYFIGVTTGKSSINRVFPKWSDALKLNAVLKGFDYVPNENPQRYLEVVQFIKNDPNSLGALVTTHKINLYRAAKDLFDGIGPYTQLLGEVSSISKQGNELWGHAKDPITSGISLEAIVEEDYWRKTGGEMLIMGAGGSSLALTLYLHNKKKDGGDIPTKIYVTNWRSPRLDEMKAIHQEIEFNIPIEYIVAPSPEKGDQVAALLKPHSMVINATGLGKDKPGSPLTDAVDYPENGIAWDFNYRGDLIFLDQARAQMKNKNLHIEDGWVYFIHGWTRVIAEVFHTDIPTSGPEFDNLSTLAAHAVGGR
jgi:shikimate 5-dehydrogenase